VRAAVGRMQGASPQKLTRSELKKIFRSFGAHPAAGDEDAKTLVLNYAEMSAAVGALGVRLTPEENKEMLVEMDTADSGVISFDDFMTWCARGTAQCCLRAHTETETPFSRSNGALTRVCVCALVAAGGRTWCRPARCR
jgi:hypothetical protein